jgi:predicted transposase YbfD/YdcC
MKVKASQAQELKKALESIPDSRKANGLRHRQASVLAIALCAVISGCRSFLAIGEWASRCTQNMLKRLGCYFHEEKQCYTAPSESTIRRVLQSMDIEAMEPAFNNWLSSLSEGQAEALAVDGKVLKGARDDDNNQVHLLSAVLHGQGLTIAQLKVESKTNEIPALLTLLEPLNIKGKVVTADALHTQKKTAKYLVQDKEAHYLFTVKENQPTLRADIAAIDMDKEKPHHETTNKGHGRVENRKIWVSSELNDYLDFPYVGQVFCIVCNVFDCKKQTEREEKVYGITDLTPKEASPERLLKLNRGHWEIENRSHYVRDVTFDEDRSQVRTQNGPQVMASLRNFAIGTLRVVKKAKNIASALRDIAASPRLALQIIGL